MDKQDIIRTAENFAENSKLNYIGEDLAISKDLVGMKIFDAPIFGFASVDDEYFKLLKEPGAIGEHFMLPTEWLPGAKTVISFFLPFGEEVRKGNRRDMSWPSPEWLHGRIEGQNFVRELLKHLKGQLTEKGYESLIPGMDERFWCDEKEKFTSNWSERHVAFVSGLGTFGLSKGLITKKGIAGRFGSIVTKLELAPDVREYTDIYEYCTMCGKCAKNCPADAITLENGKMHKPCSEFVDLTAEKFKPRYGCGKCQVSVPCECGIPKKRNTNTK